MSPGRSEVPQLRLSAWQSIGWSVASATSKSSRSACKVHAATAFPPPAAVTLGCAMRTRFFAMARRTRCKHERYHGGTFLMNSPGEVALFRDHANRTNAALDIQVDLHLGLAVRVVDPTVAVFLQALH